VNEETMAHRGAVLPKEVSEKPGNFGSISDGGKIFLSYPERPVTSNGALSKFHSPGSREYFPWN